MRDSSERRKMVLSECETVLDCNAGRKRDGAQTLVALVGLTRSRKRVGRRRPTHQNITSLVGLRRVSDTPRMRGLNEADRVHPGEMQLLRL